MRRQGKKMQKLEGKMLVCERESLEGHWERMICCMGKILSGMRWVTSEMLESACLDDQRKWVKEWEPDSVGKDVGRGPWDFWKSQARDADAQQPASCLPASAQQPASCLPASAQQPASCLPDSAQQPASCLPASVQRCAAWSTCSQCCHMWR